MKQTIKLFSLALLLFAATFLLSFPASAEVYSGNAGEWRNPESITWSLDAETGVLTFSGTGEMGEGDASTGYTAWSRYKSGIKTVIIEDGITTIIESAFDDMENLHTVIIGNSVEKIGKYAFDYCNALTNITLPDSVVAIGEGAFRGCGNLTEINIPPKVTVISRELFAACESLEGIELHEGILTVYGSAFDGCTSIKSLNIPASVTLINDKFYYDVNISEENTIYCDIDGVVFTKDKKTLISYPSKRTDTQYTVPSGVENIGEDAFSDCTSLTSIIIPDSVTSIGDSAFSGCKSLEGIVIPKNVVLTFDEFSGIDIDKISLTADNTRYCYENGVFYSKDKKILYSYLYNNKDTAEAFVIPDGVTTLADRSLSYGPPIIYIPKSVIEIGTNAFTANYVFYEGTEEEWNSIEINLQNWYNEEDSMKFFNSEGIGNVTELSKWSFIVNDDGTSVTITGYYGGEKDIIVPSQIASYSVTDCRSSFYWGKNANVHFPDTIETIDPEECTYFAEIHVSSTHPNYSSYEGMLFSKDRTRLLVIPALSGSSYKKIKLPKELSEIPKELLESYIGDKRISFEIDEENPYFCASGGVIFSKDKKTLEYYAYASKDYYQIPNGVETIADMAFCRDFNYNREEAGHCLLRAVYVPKTVTKIEDNAFGINRPGAYDEGISAFGDACYDPDDDYDFYNRGWLEDVIIYYEGTEEEWSKIEKSQVNNDVLDRALKIFECKSEDMISSFNFRGEADTENNTIVITESLDKYSKTLEFPKKIAYYDVTGVKYVSDGSRTYDRIYIPQWITFIADGAFADVGEITNVFYAGTEAEWNKISIGVNNAPLLESNIVFGINGEYNIVGYDLIYKINEDTQTVTITDYKGKDKRVVIPETIEGYTVTAIGNSAFWNCITLREIIIPDSITSIGRSAFDSCKELESISIPNGVTVIPEWTFNDCMALRNVVIPDSVTSIKKSAFRGCRVLESISIPSNVTSIDTEAFSGCASLERISIPDGITVIYQSTFDGCTSLKEVSLPDSLTKIDFYAFEECISLESISIPRKVNSLSSDSFSGCIGLKTVSVDENNEAFISVDGVLYSKDLSKLILYPSSRAGEAYSIPDSTLVIGEDAFTNCKYLKSVKIPVSIRAVVGYTNFSNCFALTDFIVEEGNEYYRDDDGVLLRWNSIEKYPAGRKGEYIIPDYITDISSGAFVSCKYLTDITLQENITGIGDMAFSGCSSLQNITIPDSVESLGYSAFEGCTSLENITLSNSITEIESNTFSDCSSLQSISIPNNVTSIGNYAFAECDNLQSITIPNSVTTLGKHVFDECDSLESVVLSKKMSVIEDYTFDECSKLKSIVIPKNITEISEWAFSSCRELTDVYYTGSEEQWNQIVIGNGNNELNEAAITFNYSDGSATPGDINGNETIDIQDLVLLAQYLANWQVDISEDGADCDGDGNIAIGDLVRLAQYLANWDVTLG